MIAESASHLTEVTMTGLITGIAKEIVIEIGETVTAATAGAGIEDPLVGFPRGPGTARETETPLKETDTDLGSRIQLLFNFLRRS